MLKHFFLTTTFAVTMMSVASANSRFTSTVNYGNPDHYVFIADDGGVSCDEARLLLEDKGYDIYKTVRCNGNYHVFKVERRGFRYIVHVLSPRGAEMLNLRSR